MTAVKKPRSVIAIAALVALTVAVLVIVWHLRNSVAESQLAIASPIGVPIPNQKPLDSAPELAAPISIDPGLPETAASELARAQREYATWVRSVVQELLRRGDGASLAVAGRLMFSNREYFEKSVGENYATYRQNTIDLFKRAAELSPRDPVIQRMALWACSEMFVADEPQKYGCDRDVYAKALRASDSGNAAVWLSELGNAIDKNAKEANSGVLREEILVAMGSATAFHDYGAAEVALVREAVESIRVPPPSTPLGELHPANRLLLTWPHRPTQSVKPLVEACQPNGGTQLVRMCHDVATLMLDKGSVSYATTALRIEGRLAPPSSSRATEVAEAQRRLSWQVQQVQFVGRIRGKAPSFVESSNTVVQLETLLRENGVPLDPPDDWP